MSERESTALWNTHTISSSQCSSKSCYKQHTSSLVTRLILSDLVIFLCYSSCLLKADHHRQIRKQFGEKSAMTYHRKCGLCNDQGLVITVGSLTCREGMFVWCCVWLMFTLPASILYFLLNNICAYEFNLLLIHQSVRSDKHWFLNNTNAATSYTTIQYNIPPQPFHRVTTLQRFLSLIITLVYMYSITN